MFKNVYNGKKVLITGNTGFKGSWLSLWLMKLGAKVVGISKDIPTSPSMFSDFIADKVKWYENNICDLANLKKIIDEEKPDFIFHLAAQAIVSTSYSNPIETIQSNVIGTTNLLEVLRSYNDRCIAIFITSDKCYDNVEWVWGYRETDGLGGKDIYSGSKGAAELIIKSYINSFFNNEHNVKIGVGRAGNVIGGGDWAKDRIIVDIVKAWSENKKVEIRSPNATRPWQHVLEPLSGYLLLGEQIANMSSEVNQGDQFNFGPKAEQNRTVLEIVKALSFNWNFKNTDDSYIITDNIKFKESSLLKLNCDKALNILKWESNLEYKETMKLVSDWYYNYFNANVDMFKFTLNQITEFENIAIERNKSWIQ
jgi:CDP-glucose 4,6-dehydratase